MSKLGKMKSFITSLFGIKEYRLNSEGKLDVSVEDYVRLTESYGAEFITKFEKMLGEEAVSFTLNGQDLASHLKNGTKQSMTDMKFKFLCAVLAVQTISLEEGKISLTEEQLEKIEAGLKKLEDEKTAAETNLATASTAKAAAEGALTAVTTAMDELGTTIKAAKTPADKVEAIRLELAKKPAAAATGTQTKTDVSQKAKIEGADAINEVANDLIN